jgi:hypothetical protein
VAASERPIRHNGSQSAAWRSADEPCISIPSSLGRYLDLYRHHSAVFARYEQEGLLSRRQLRLIEALFIEGVSLRDFAAREEVTPQAITARLEAIATRAPEFIRWWRRVNGNRRRR